MQLIQLTYSGRELPCCFSEKNKKQTKRFFITLVALAASVSSVLRWRTVGSVLVIRTQELAQVASKSSGTLLSSPQS